MADDRTLRRTLRHDGLAFDVHEGGPGDGEAVVLLHGFPQTSTCWDGVAPRLHAAGLRTLALDQRGYSAGARPRGRRSYTLDLLVGDVAALIEESGGPAHVVGHDWGAAVAWSLAATRPELVRTLTAVSVPHPRAFREALRTDRDQRRRSRYMAIFLLPLVPERVLSGRGGERFLGRSGMGPAALARYRAEIVDGGALSPALGWYRALPLSRGRGLGRRVRVPTTYLWSNRDGALGRTGAELTASCVEADYRFVEVGGSHWIPDEQPEAVADAVLDRVARAGGPA